MISIPIEYKNHKHDALVIVLGRDDLLKMQDAIPVQISIKDMSAQTGKKVHQPTIVVCYEEDHVPIMQFLQKGDIIGGLRYLQRGLMRKENNPIQSLIERGIGE